ncbi:DUF5011 domain-containing protein [Colwellia psychrerythraea]|uniref:Putative surface protein n=1 Tax=Colwellia psychrerythraea (strain 34H / ATCC BAA-681) TaxID=167879 RepID=Q482B7_COLP3|nr:DUF5011 domain-containing protein [Colwellia psychrerythraea]AAZ24273.1 putative surface protein [Colwellia psychrerythraea 34H]
MSYLKSRSSNINSIQSYTLKTVAAAVMLSLSSGAYAACDYTAGDDFDNDGVTNLQDGAPCDTDLQQITINRVINSDFEAGANFWAKVSADASYTSVDNSFDGSKAIEMTTTKNNKGLSAPDMTGDGFSSITLRFWAKAVTVSDHTAPLKIKLTLKAEDGSLNGKGAPTSDKFLAPILVDNQDDPDLADDVTIINASEWTPISRTFVFADIQAEADEAIALGGLTTGTRIALTDGKYNDIIKLQIQPAKAGDVILIDNVSLFSDTDKATMQFNVITDTDDDGLMNDADAHPTQAYFTESKPGDDFDGDGIINSADTHPYSTTPATDLNNDGYDDTTAPLINALASSTTTLELLDAEQDNWSVVKFVSSKDAKIGETSYKVNNAATSKANIVTIDATEQVSLGFWAKTDVAGFAATGEAFFVKARLIKANADDSDVFVNLTLTDTDLSTEWQYFQLDKNLSDTQTANEVELILLKPTIENLGNLWIDGITLFADQNTDALLAAGRDSDSDGIPDFNDNDDDNDGLLDGEDLEPLNAIGSFDAPDIDHDGVADTADVDTDGILDYFEDRTAPVLTLSGSNISIQIGGEYNELGATALDDTDGDITANISVSGSVDTSTLGDYTLSYDVMDAEANAAITLTRVVSIVSEEVIDTSAPIISLIGDASFSVIEGGSYTDAGATALDETDGDITANITSTGSVDTAVIGTYVITYTVSDAAGNIATLTRDVTVGSTDATAPVITLVGETNIIVVEGEEYTDAGALAEDERDGDISVNIVVTGSVDVSTTGSYTLTYNISDAAGNSAEEVTREVTVVSDAVPVFSGALPELTFHKTSVDAVIILSDLTDAPVAIDEKDGAITATTGFKDTVYQPGKTYTITWKATNSAGNSSEITQNLTVTAPEVVIEEVESKGGSFSFAGLFLMVGLFTRRLLTKK